MVSQPYHALHTQIIQFQTSTNQGVSSATLKKEASRPDAFEYKKAKSVPRASLQSIGTIYARQALRNYRNAIGPFGGAGFNSRWNHIALAWSGSGCKCLWVHRLMTNRSIFVHISSNTKHRSMLSDNFYRYFGASMHRVVH